MRTTSSRSRIVEATTTATGLWHSAGSYGTRLEVVKITQIPGYATIRIG